MNGHLTVLADQDRVELFSVLGRSKRLFQHALTWTDEEGISWAGVRVGMLGIALTALGPGWVFDEAARDAVPAQERQGYEKRLRAMQRAGEEERERRLTETIRDLRLGGHA